MFMNSASRSCCLQMIQSRNFCGLNRNSSPIQKTKYFYQNARGKCGSSCPPPKPPPGQCGCPPRPIVPPPDCRPGPIPPNPCCPVFHHGTNTYKKYKYIFFFVCVPLILFQMFNALSACHKPKGVCREYEYMLRRTKRYPWGDGQKTFFHNDHVNHLPGDCMPPPLICDD